MDRTGRAGRAIARKRALQAILKGRTPAQLAALDALLAFDSAIRQTRFGWLGAWSDSPGAANLNGLLDRLDFLRGLAMDPTCRETVHPDRWKQIVREGDAAPAWLADDFGADRRRATLLAYLISLQERLTDEAIHMFCKQIGRLFARAAAACEERHKSSRKEATAALRLFRDTLRVLMEANANNGDAIEMLHAKVGWRRLVEAQPSVEAMVAEKAVNPLPVAAQHHAGLRRYAPRFLAAFQFRASRRGDPMIAAIELLTQMHRENRRALPNKFPIRHLDEPAKKLILAGGKPDRPLYEVATLGALRDRLRSGDIWVEGSRAYRPLDEYLMPTGAFTEKKDTDRLNLGVPGDAPAWLDSMRRTLDFQLKQLAYRACAGKLEGVRLVGGALVVSPLESEVPEAAEALNSPLTKSSSADSVLSSRHGGNQRWRWGDRTRFRAICWRRGRRCRARRDPRSPIACRTCFGKLGSTRSLKGCASRITRRGWARRRFRRGGISACTLSATSRGSTASAASRGGGASARDYQRLKAGLDRLLSTTVATSIRQAAERRRHRFSWINEWKERADANGRALGVELILPDWFYAGVLEDALVLTIDRAYFSLTGGLERWLYRVVRKHGGRQEYGWSFDLAHLHAKFGSLS